VIENGRTIAVNYRPGAGGNFVQNCLGLSRHCVLRDRKYAEWQLTATVDENFYQQKLAWAIETIQPGVIDAGWLGYELGANTFIGFIFSDSLKTTDTDIPKVLHQAAQQNLWVTHTAHNHGWTEHLTRYWPQVRYINVHGDTWAQRWMNVKNPGLPGPNGYPVTDPQGRVVNEDWEPSPVAYDFDIDAVINSESDFLQAMRTLYEWLEWDDFDQAPVAEYYRAYKQAHDQQQNL
jgi:hypothetical protein